MSKLSVAEEDLLGKGQLTAPRSHKISLCIMLYKYNVVIRLTKHAPSGARRGSHARGACRLQAGQEVTAELAADDGHALTVARLRHERAAREALVRQLDGLRAEKVPCDAIATLGAGPLVLTLIPTWLCPRSRP